MKKLLLICLSVCAISASAAEHRYLSLLQGPLVVGITNNGSTTPSVINTTVSTTTLGGGGALDPIIYYTNNLGTSVLANTNYYFYVTNSVYGDTTDTGWRTNRSSVNNPGPFVDVPVWSDANGNATSLNWTLTYSKTGTATHGTNSATFLLYRSYDGVNFESSALVNILVNSAVTISKTTTTTNLSTSFLTGVKTIRFVGFSCAAAASGSTSTFTIHASGISGFKP